MTDSKISALTEVTSPAGTDVLPIVSGGDTKKVTVDNLLAGVGGELLHATLVLTNAQTKALPTTAVTIVTAGGANTAILPMFASLHMNWTADYSNIDSTAQLALRGPHDIGFQLLSQDTLGGISNLLAGGQNAWSFMGPESLTKNAATNRTRGESGYSDSDVVNKNLRVVITNGASGDLTGGDAANTLRVDLWYVLLDFNA